MAEAIASKLCCPLRCPFPPSSPGIGAEGTRHIARSVNDLQVWCRPTSPYSGD